SPGHFTTARRSHRRLRTPRTLRSRRSTRRYLHAHLHGKPRHRRARQRPRRTSRHHTQPHQPATQKPTPAGQPPHPPRISGWPTTPPRTGCPRDGHAHRKPRPHHTRIPPALRSHRNQPPARYFRPPHGRFSQHFMANSRPDHQPNPLVTTAFRQKTRLRPHRRPHALCLRHHDRCTRLRPTRTSHALPRHTRVHNTALLLLRPRNRTRRTTFDLHT